MSKNRTTIKVCRNLVLIGSLLTSVSFAQTCTEKETLGNNNKVKILKNLNKHTKKVNKNIGVGRLHSVKARNLTFSGCHVKVTFDAKLKRMIFPNQRGTVKLKAYVTSITKNKICISNTKLKSFSLSPSWNSEKVLYKKIGKPFLKQATGCMKY